MQWLNFRLCAPSRRRQALSQPSRAAAAGDATETDMFLQACQSADRSVLDQPNSYFTFMNRTRARIMGSHPAGNNTLRPKPPRRWKAYIPDRDFRPRILPPRRRAAAACYTRRSTLTVPSNPTRTSPSIRWQVCSSDPRRPVRLPPPPTVPESPDVKPHRPRFRH